MKYHSATQLPSASIATLIQTVTGHTLWPEDAVQSYKSEQLRQHRRPPWALAWNVTLAILGGVILLATMILAGLASVVQMIFTRDKNLYFSETWAAEQQKALSDLFLIDYWDRFAYVKLQWIQCGTTDDGEYYLNGQYLRVPSPVREAMDRIRLNLPSPSFWVMALGTDPILNCYISGQKFTVLIWDMDGDRVVFVDPPAS